MKKCLLLSILILCLFFSLNGYAAFPTVAATNGGIDTSDGTNHTINLPANISAGDLLIVIFGFDASGYPTTMNFPEGWSELFEKEAPSYVGLSAGYRIADGEEGATITVTTSTSEKSSHISYRITGYSGVPEVGVAVELSPSVSDSPNPPSLAPTWGAKDTLWLAIMGSDGYHDVSAYPTDYSGGLFQNTGESTGATTGSAQRNLNTASEDPGVFTISGDNQWVANTIAIQPEGVPAGIVWNGVTITKWNGITVTKINGK